MARISIFGIGYVGVVSAACLARDGHQVIAVDIDPERVRRLNEGQAPIVEAGLDALLARVVREGRLVATTDAQSAIAQTETTMVCVGTPSEADGSVGLRHVIAVCGTIGRALAEKEGYHSVILRSTIVPGTMETVCIPTLETQSGKQAGEGFGVGYFPEFLRESTAIEDYDNPGLIVFGALDTQTADVLHALNADLPCPHNEVGLRTAEMVKYTSNCWRATKVGFANEIGNIAKAAGLDGQEVMRLLCSDTKVAMTGAFLRPGFAFGGSCLPKDVRALRRFGDELGVETPILDSVLAANLAQIDRAQTMVRAAAKKHVGMIGVSFKAGTDDLRESPLAHLATRLIAEGIEVRVYDPFVATAFAADPAAAQRAESAVPGLSSRIETDIEALIEGSDIVVVGNLYDEARAPLRRALEGRKTIEMVDLARLDRGLTSTAGYQGICW